MSKINQYVEQVPFINLRQLARELCREYRSICGSTHYILSDIFYEIDYSELDQVLENTRDNPNRFYGIIFHEEKEERGHLHFYHSCPYTGSHCRCIGLRFIRNRKQRSRRKVLQSDQCSEEWWFNWLQYYCRESRSIVELLIGKTSFTRSLYRLKNIPGYQGNQIENTLRDVEGSEFSCEGSNTRKRKRNPENDEQAEETDNGVNIQRQKSESLLRPGWKKKMKDNNALVSNLENILCVPIISTCELPVWINDKILSFYDTNDADYRRAVNFVNRKFINLSFEDIRDITESANPNYYARQENHYYNRQESYEVVYKLLLHQYQTEIEVKKFVKRLYDICEKKIEKKNTIIFSGPPNAGKTYFSMFFLAFYINVGHIANFTRGQNFPLNDACHRRILFWNEPSICPSQYDTVKMLLGGDPCPAKKKYSDDITISRTPVIINTNNERLFSNQEVWNTRVYHERWTTAPFLKKCNRYPLPTAYIDLINRFID
uniref:Nonstructural protein 1 n=1 Tax=Motacilla cinerea ambidensovirus TaxID=2794458 RepID=A0A8A4XEK2_9VIRU|nr:MAG: nonstructural protein 1 [Motacilla cinerea ambidensovirus]